MTHRSVPVVVFVGRPNVGKSTLFNRVTGTRRSIVAPIPGTTRDLITQSVVWNDRPLTLTDTGGLFGASEDPLHALVIERGRRALASADLIVMVVDGREGLVAGDEEVASAVRTTGVPVLVAVNKADDRRTRDGALEFHRLGFDPVIEVSAEHGTGVGDLMDAVVERLPAGALQTAVVPGPETAVAIVGRPNAGKSSLVNLLLQEERMIVSEVPGTTRDSVDSVLTWHGQTVRLVDTAGIRRPGKVAKAGAIEGLSVMLARRAIERADVVVLVLDATAGIADQDAAIIGAAVDAGRGIVVVANKWDLMKDRGPDAAKVFDEDLRFRMKFLDFAPVLHVSAKTGERASKLLEAVDRVARARTSRISTGELNRFIEQITAAHIPVAAGRRRVRILYAVQTAVAPPTFVLFTNVASELHFSYLRYLENRLREQYGFFGSPIRITVRRREPRRTGGDGGRDGTRPAKEK